MIALNVTYQARPGMRERFVEEVKARGLLDAIRGEKGCARYEYFAALEDPDRLLLLENWADEAALEAHQKSPAMAALRAVKEKYMVSTDIKRY